MHPIGRKELWHAQVTLIVAIILQLSIANELRVGPRFLVAGLEAILVIGLFFTAPRRHSTAEKTHITFATLMICLVSLANAGQLGILIGTLINGTDLPGRTLLTSAMAIFLTNIIMFGIWYWELDSPGLSGRHKEGNHFQFPQKESMHANIRHWEPSFFDYLYVSLTNGSAFSPTDTLPLTHTAKALMSGQALISLLTVVLVTARAVNILS